MEGKKSGKENIFLFYKFAFQIFFLIFISFYVFEQEKTSNKNIFFF